MKKSDIYEIALKVIGIYSLTLIYWQLGTMINFMSDFFSFSSSASDNAKSVLQLVAALVVFFIMAIVPWLFLFKTKRIVKLICPPGDYEDVISIVIEPKVIYEIALIVTGSVMILWALPDFTVKLFNYLNFIRSDFSLTATASNKIYIITAIIKFIFGGIAIAYAKPIALYFAKKQIREETDAD